MTILGSRCKAAIKTRRRLRFFIGEVDKNCRNQFPGADGVMGGIGAMRLLGTEMEFASEY